MNLKKIYFFSDVAIILIVSLVFIFSYLSGPIIPIAIYGEKTISAIYSGNKSKNNVSLMFNVYENTEVVQGILKVLEEKNVSATFFVGGCWADDNKKTLNDIVNANCELANHGYFHKDHKNISYEKNLEEIKNAGEMIELLTGVKPNLFAPPSGSYSEVTLEVADKLGYKTIMWSKDTIDWRDKDENTILSRATKNLSNGDLILMHPKEHTLNVLPKIIDFILENGYNIVTVGKNIE